MREFGSKRMKQAAAAAVAVCLLAFPAGAQTLRDAVEGAWRLNPEIRSLEARRGQAVAQRGAGESLVPAAPAVTLRHITDMVGRNVGRREYEAEVGVPLWLPGQGTATVRAADALLARTDAEIAARQLAIAGEVRTALWQIALLERRVELARQRLAVARRLEADTKRSSKAGETSEADHQLARGEALAVAAEVRDEELSLEEARQAFRTLTGATVPKATPEPLIGEQPLDRHPALQAARLGVRSAQAQRQLVDLTTRDSPEVGVLARKERDVRGERFDTIVGLSMRIPFSVDAVNALKRAEAATEVVRSEAEQANAERTIETEIRQARLAHQAATERLSIVRDRAAALKGRLSIVERARKGGEISLVEFVRAQEAAFEAELARATAEIQVGAARARLNQSLGVLP
ncbi:TolC family protein [Azospirillum lipoferum]|uniref:TolC family protein n=1 Tax=Azospirillum TaxID=191 RepID=UPI001FE8654D|nr:MULTISPECIES: TolC family protein [Azospirillum]MDW5536690.1 TolC family protein [Azospirillum sp. NL1]